MFRKDNLSSRRTSYDPVCIPIYYLSQLATNKNVKVCQVGEGADELSLDIQIG